MTQTDNPAIWAGFEATEGLELAWKIVRPDGRTYQDFQWPFKGRVVADPQQQPFTTGDCPAFPGDGLCLAKTWRGAASGGYTAITGLAIEYDMKHLLGGMSSDKYRVSQCNVLGVFDVQRLLRA